MKLKEKLVFPAWTRLGGPLAGTVSALAAAEDIGLVLFIGTKVGLYRSSQTVGSVFTHWERLPTAPIGIMSLAVSPAYSIDHIVVAGTNKGIFISKDGGDTWLAAQLPVESTMVLTIGFSPDFELDHTIIAGTLEDGVIYSETNGKTWHLKSFGLLDSAVYSLAISPVFSQDETLFAGTDTAIYYSYNQARAWKQLQFPEDAPPVLSLLISSDFVNDRTLFAGTEMDGLYRSLDQGESWEKLDFPAASINALSSRGTSLLAAAESGIYQSDDRGETWRCLLDIPNVISLVAKNKVALAGLVDQGVWLSVEGGNWEPASISPIRSMVGFVLSPGFSNDRTAWMYGPQEGIWKTVDGGLTWLDINASLPSLEIHNLVVSPEFPLDQIVLAALSEGLYISRDGGNQWQLCSARPVDRLSFSPNGKKLIASFPSEGLFISADLGQTWEAVPGPWQQGGRIVGLAITDLFDFHVAMIDGADESLSIWQGKPGKIEKVMTLPAVGDPVVSFWSPAEAAANRPWFASSGNKVWRFSSRMGNTYSESVVFIESALQESILSITGIQSDHGLLLYACTGQHIFRSTDEVTWVMVHESIGEPIIQLALDPAYAANSTAYILLLGGAFCQGILK